MAYKKIKVHKSKIANKVGESLELKCDVQVDDQSGMFRISIPEELLTNAHNNKDIDYMVQKANTKSYLVGKSLKECQEAIEKLAKDFLNVEVTKDKVLAYYYSNSTSYYKYVDGTIEPNGIHKGGVEGDWAKNTIGSFNGGAHEYGMFAIGLAASVLIRTTYKRGSNTTCEYKFYKSSFNNLITDKEDETYADKLDRFYRMGISKSGDDNIDEHLNRYAKKGMTPDEIKIIPYSEPVGKFFYDMLIGMCQLADKFQSFFGMNELEVLKSIESGRKNLLEYNGK